MVVCMVTFGGLVGCSTLQGGDGTPMTPKQYFQRYQHIMRLAVQVAVLRVLDANPTYGPRIVAFANTIQTILDDKYITLAELETLVVDEIDWSQYKPEEQLLIKALISQVRVEIENVLTINVGVPAAPEDVHMILSAFVGWVEEAAALHDAERSNRVVIPQLPPYEE